MSIFLLINTYTVNKFTNKNTIFHYVPISNVHKSAALVSNAKIAVYSGFTVHPLYINYIYIYTFAVYGILKVRSLE